MSCSCNNSYYNLPCCCPTGDPTTTHTTTQCLNGEPCEEAYSSDCVTFTGSGSTCYGVVSGSNITEVIKILIAQLPQCTTTTTAAPTTSTTTIAPNYCFTVTNTSGTAQILNVITTTGVNSLITVNPGQVLNACFRSVITAPGGPLVIVNNGICGPFCPPTTTTTTAAPQPGYCFKITNTSPTVNTGVNYVNSFGVPSVINVGANSSNFTCGLSVSSYPNIVSTIYGYCINGCNSQITTTTSTATPCLSYTIERTGGTQISYSYVGCDGITYVVTNTTNSISVVCALQGSINITAGTAVFTAGILCSLTTSTTSTTTTSTTTTIPPCISYTLNYVNTPGGSTTFAYTKCNGVETSVQITGGFTVVCAQEGSVYIVDGSGTIVAGSPCITTTTSTSTTSTSTSSTTSTTTAEPTTTTTVASFCFGLANSTLTNIEVNYYSGSGILQSVSVPASSNTVRICASSVVPSVGITISNLGDCSVAACQPTTTTSSTTTSSSTTSTTTTPPTTTTTTFEVSCYSFFNADTVLGVSMDYNDANGLPLTVIVPASSTIYVCASSVGSIPAEITVTNTGSCAYGSMCNPTTTSTTTTAAPTTTTTTEACPGPGVAVLLHAEPGGNASVACANTSPATMSTYYVSAACAASTGAYAYPCTIYLDCAMTIPAPQGFVYVNSNSWAHQVNSSGQVITWLHC